MNKCLYFSLKNPIGLRVRAELEYMLAAFFEAEFFVKILRAVIVFPDAEPERVVTDLFGVIEAFQHQRFADAFADVFIDRIQAAELDRVRSRHTRLARILF